MKQVVFVVCAVFVVAGSVADPTADPDGDILSNDILSEDLTEKGWDFLETATKEFREEGRDPLKKTLLPFLIGITLKAGSIVPAKLMLMTFIVVLALVFAKMGLAISALVGYLQYQEHHKKTLGAMTDKWVIPSTHAPSILHQTQDSLPSEPKPSIVMAPATTTQGPNTKRLQQQIYQQQTYEPYRPFDPYNADPYRFNRYDYPH